jgi:hypothetical protein
MRKMLCLGIVGATTMVSAQTSTSDGLTAGAWAQTFSMQMTKINGQPAPPPCRLRPAPKQTVTQLKMSQTQGEFCLLAQSRCVPFPSFR